MNEAELKDQGWVYVNPAKAITVYFRDGSEPVSYWVQQPYNVLGQLEMDDEPPNNVVRFYAYLGEYGTRAYDDETNIIHSHFNIAIPKNNVSRIVERSVDNRRRIMSLYEHVLTGEYMVIIDSEQ